VVGVKLLPGRRALVLGGDVVEVLGKISFFGKGVVVELASPLSSSDPISDRYPLDIKTFSHFNY
jgi:hypothetical protein